MTYNTDSVLYHKITADEAFIVSEMFTLTSGSSGNVHIRNPSDSGKTIWIADIVVSGNGAYTAQVHDQFSSGPSGGSDAPIQALKLDTESVDNDGVVDANMNVTYTSSSEHAVGVSGGGGSGSSIGGVRQHTTMAVEPGREIVVAVENTASNENNYSVSVIYFETPD